MMMSVLSLVTTNLGDYGDGEPRSHKSFRSAWGVRPDNDMTNQALGMTDNPVLVHIVIA